jgi:endothelin-converting enzyme/putative endopeptidase
MHVRRLAVRAAALIAAVALIATAPPAKPLTALLSPAYRDPGCPACRDFYQYATGGWLKANPIPADRSYWGIESNLDEQNLKLLRHALETDEAKHLAAGTSGQLAADYYTACNDMTARDAAGSAPLKTELTAIDGITDAKGFIAESARLGKIGAADSVFAIYPSADNHDSSRTIADIGQSGLSLPERDYYFRTDATSVKLRDAFVKHAAKLLELTGEDATAAAADAATVMRVETAIATPQYPSAKLRDPKLLDNPTTLPKMAAFGSTIDWTTVFADTGIPGNVKINVDEPPYLTAIDKLVAATPVADLKTYLKFHYVNGTAGALGTPFVDEQFAFNKLLTGAKQQLPLWKRCIGSTNGAMRDIMGQIFVSAAFSPEQKAHANTMVDNLRATLHADIATLPWMSPVTKVKAEQKLTKMIQKIGYPSPSAWRTYPGLVTTPTDYFADVQSASAVNTAQMLARIGKPTKRTDWGMGAQEINAQYDPTNNDITFPAAILLPPYFDAEDDDAFNYGAEGAVIGHEMTHGFDDQGRQYDANGNLKNWWTPSDAKRFNAKAHCIITQFDHTVAVGKVHYTGDLDSGEAIADLGGAKIAYDAYERAAKGKPRTLIDGYTPEQRFFIAFAMSWAANERDEAARQQAQTDPHPLNRDRVLSVVENMPEFAAAFHCKPGDKMVNPPAKLCKIW